MTKYPKIESVEKIAVVGTGTIGSSWATYFLAQGYKVQAWDPGLEWQKKIGDFIDNAWPQMETLGLHSAAKKSNITLCSTLKEAVSEADFVQESAPEQMELKQQLFSQLHEFSRESAIISSSTSGLIMSDMQNGILSADRFVVGHPFNPPHLIPLVEVVGGNATAPGAIDWTIEFYNHMGKHAIKIKKEVPGHLANRLQAALWREAVLAVKNDLASVEDINAAVARGPGLRWALMGPHMIMHLAGGKGGISQMLHHFAPGIQEWWLDMAENPILNDELQKTLIAGIEVESGDRSIETLEQQRDEQLIKILKMLSKTEGH